MTARLNYKSVHISILLLRLEEREQLIEARLDRCNIAFFLEPQLLLSGGIVGDLLVLLNQEGEGSCHQLDGCSSIPSCGEQPNCTL